MERGERSRPRRSEVVEGWRGEEGEVRGVREEVPGAWGEDKFWLIVVGYLVLVVILRRRFDSPDPWWRGEGGPWRPWRREQGPPTPGRGPAPRLVTLGNVDVHLQGQVR